MREFGSEDPECHQAAPQGLEFQKIPTSDGSGRRYGHCPRSKGEVTLFSCSGEQLKLWKGLRDSGVTERYILARADLL